MKFNKNILFLILGLLIVLTAMAKFIMYLNNQKMKSTVIEVEASIDEDLEKVWHYYTRPEHIINWNFASDDWHCPSTTNDLKPGGKYSTRMEAKDESFGFDYNAIYDEVVLHKKIAYTIDDGRSVNIDFDNLDVSTRMTIVFEAEYSNSIQMQKDGWQSIVNNFKKYVEEKSAHMIKQEIEVRANAEKIWDVITMPEYAKVIGHEFDENAFLSSDWELDSEVHFMYEPDKIVVTGKITDIIENEMIYIDFNFDQYKYYEKISLNKQSESVILEINSGPFGSDYDAQKVVWNNWLNKVKELSEAKG